MNVQLFTVPFRGAYILHKLSEFVNKTNNINKPAAQNRGGRFFIRVTISGLFHDLHDIGESRGFVRLWELYAMGWKVTYTTASMAGMTKVWVSVIS